MTPTYEDIVTAIFSGNLDDRLLNLYRIIRERLTNAGKSKLHTLQVGQEVTLCPNITPEYLRNKKAIVRKINRTTVVVDLVIPIGIYSRGIRCSPSFLVV